MNFRHLIEKAMHEARDEFAEVVARKVEALIGVEAGGKPRIGRPPKGVAPVLAPRRRSSNRRGGQRRAPPEHMAKVQENVLHAMMMPPTRDRSRREMAKVEENVLHAMRPGEAMKKGAIMKAARLGEDDDVRVRNVLAKLKTAGVLTMKGLRGSATYTLKG